MKPKVKHITTALLSLNSKNAGKSHEIGRRAVKLNHKKKSSKKN